MNQQKGFFDEQIRLEILSHQGDPLERLSRLVNWEIFRRPLKACFQKLPKGPGGRPPFDYLVMFKILVLQRLYNLSDAQMQYQLLDRLSFMRFLGLGLQSQVPDEKTIWLFRETLTTQGVIEQLFEKFNHYLRKKRIVANQGSIVDASFVEVPRQRNDRDENEQIKQGKVPEEWKTKEAMLRQKDVDARWTKKNEQTFYGYKDHVKVDRQSKLITAYAVTDASVHDSQALSTLLEKSDAHHELYADSAYSGEPIAAVLKKGKICNRIQEKGVRNNPLTETQRGRNRQKSKVRARVEHVFGHITISMKGFYIRSIGIARARTNIGMINLVYNIYRYAYLQRA